MTVSRALATPGALNRECQLATACTKGTDCFLEFHYITPEFGPSAVHDKGEKGFDDFGGRGEEREQLLTISANSCRNGCIEVIITH